MNTTECHVTQHSEYCGGIQFSTSIQCDKGTQCAGHEKKRPGNMTQDMKPDSIFLSFIAKFSE